MTEAGKFPILPDAPNLLVRYAGVIEAGAFLVVDEIVQYGHRTVRIAPDPRFSPTRQYAFEVRGDSMNQVGIAEPADGRFTCWVLAVDYLEYVEFMGPPQTGDFVLVQRTRDGGHTIERTLKEIKWHKDQIELIPRSTNPTHQPVFVPQKNFEAWEDDGTEIRIIAVYLSHHVLRK